MSDSIFSGMTAITVGVSFDAQSVALVRLGATLAKSLNKTLRLVHVVEPWVGLSAQAGPFATPYPIWETLKAVEDQNRKDAEKRLADLAATAAPGAKAALVVATGAPVDALAREAAVSNSFLLLVGISKSSHGALHGASTAHSPVATSPVPVLSIDTATRPSFADAPPKILVADDLSDVSEGALVFAAAFADGFKGVRLHHVHVAALAEAQMRVALESAAAASRAPLGKHEVEDVYNAFVATQTDRLAERFEAHREYLEARGGVYTAEVVPGGVRPELAGVVREFGPDLLVFGRHKAFHTRPFSLGRMPHRSMLAYGCPVAVVPKL